MITHDSEFEALAKAPIKTTDVVVAKQIVDPYGYVEDTPVWTSSDLLMSVSIDSIGAFLGTTTKKATVQLLGVVEGVIAEDIFQIRLGLYNDDPSVAGFTYISEGFFVVQEVEYNYEAGSTKITMYDYMWIAQNTPYKTTTEAAGFAYPSTVETLANQMAVAIGADLMEGFSDLPNATYEILVDPYATISNVTIQNVIQEIASATGTTARMSDTTLVFSQFKDGI